MEIKKFNFNQNYFNKIDSPEKAYMLGLIYSDGCIYPDKNSSSKYIIFGQSEEYKDIVELFNNTLNSNYPIHSTVRGSKLFYYVRLTSEICYNDLINLGVVPNKSLIIKFPNFIQDDFIPSFILGCFDGDGCVWNGKRKKMKVKDASKPSGYRERIVHNVKFTYTGNYEFVNALQDYLVKTLGFKKTKLNFSKAKNSNNTTSKNVCTMEYSGRKQLKKFYDLIYDKSKIFGKIKKKKFEEIFCASDEKSSVETVLTEETAEMPIVNQASNIEEGSSTIPEMGVESSDSKCTAPNE